MSPAISALVFLVRRHDGLSCASISYAARSMLNDLGVLQIQCIIHQNCLDHLHLCRPALGMISVSGIVFRHLTYFSEADHVEVVQFCACFLFTVHVLEANIKKGGS